MEEIVQPMLEFRNQIKLYHWKTDSYARHKATCKYLELFAEKTDQFIEVLIGSRGKKVSSNFAIKFKNVIDKNATGHVEKFREWVSDTLPTLLHEHEPDLLNLKDELLADLNRLLYLFKLQ